jgi:hypothetical protein
MFHEAEDAGNIPVGEKVLGLGKMFRKNDSLPARLYQKESMGILMLIIVSLQQSSMFRNITYESNSNTSQFYCTLYNIHVDLLSMCLITKYSRF